MIENGTSRRHRRKKLHRRKIIKRREGDVLARQDARGDPVFAQITIGPEELMRLLVDRAAEHPPIDLCRESPTTGRSPNVADNSPPPAVEAELLSGLDLFLNSYLGGAAVGVFERQKRGHTIYIGSSRRERERDDHYAPSTDATNVLRSTDHPNEVFIYLEYSSLEDANEARDGLVSSGVLAGLSFDSLNGRPQPAVRNRRVSGTTRLKSHLLSRRRAARAGSARRREQMTSRDLRRVAVSLVRNAVSRLKPRRKAPEQVQAENNAADAQRDFVLKKARSRDAVTDPDR